MNQIFETLTNKPDTANALAAIASAIVAFIAFLVSLLSLYVTHATLKHQRRHNILSVKPLPQVSSADYENRLVVRVRNDGSGPLIIKDVRVENGSQMKESLIDWMPELPEGMYWTTFVSSIKNRSVTPGNQIVLLELSGDDSQSEFREARDRCRAALRPLTVVVEYTDIYDSKMKPHEKSLSWFGRRLTNEVRHHQPKTGAAPNTAPQPDGCAAG